MGTHFGVELDRMNTDVSKTPRAYYEKVKLLLSERFIGFFMIPSQSSRNYNFMGVGLDPYTIYVLSLSNLQEIYHEVHRPSHFMNLASIKEAGETVEADRKDMFSQEGWQWTWSV